VDRGFLTNIGKVKPSVLKLTMNNRDSSALYELVIVIVKLTPIKVEVLLIPKVVKL
jgi:hypothetical protein